MNTNKIGKSTLLPKSIKQSKPPTKNTKNDTITKLCKNNIPSSPSNKKLNKGQAKVVTIVEAPEIPKNDNNLDEMKEFLKIAFENSNFKDGYELGCKLLTNQEEASQELRARMIASHFMSKK